MKVGLLGGSFNPAHPGHVHISNLAIKKLRLNQVWWIPTARNPLKDPAIYASYSKRLDQCRKLAKNPKIKVKEFDEIYTDKLIRKLHLQYKSINFIWIMGDDSFVTLHKWKNFKKLIKLTSFAVFSRETFFKVRQTKAFFAKPKAVFFANKVLKISSSQLRNAA